jgi:hypothetical protein
MRSKRRIDDATAVAGSGATADYAAGLLGDLGAHVDRVGGIADLHPDLEWARCGAMALTGPADAAPVLAPGAVTTAARGALEVLRAVARTQRFPAAALKRLEDVDAGVLLGERAACLDLRRRGPVSPGGSCRMLRAADGWICLNLPRPDDVGLLPAWLCEEIGEGDPWDCARDRVSRCAAEPLVERGRELGLAVAVVPASSRVAAVACVAGRGWCRVQRLAPAEPKRSSRPLRVVDLSSLWAGPLCTQLLSQAGARVVKVESRSRLDGARRGDARFFDLLNADKASVVLDFSVSGELDELRRLLDAADIVVESARPRALAQLGIDARRWVAEGKGRTWLSITGYGRRDPGAGWVAFGDDAAAAAGLVVSEVEGVPCFCGDAIADPLAGLHGAAAALFSHTAGGGRLLDVSLHGVAARARSTRFEGERARVERMARETGEQGRWMARAGGSVQPVLEPRARWPERPARSPGADTDAILRELAESC